MTRRFVVRSAVAYLFLFWLPTPIDSLPWVGDAVTNATTKVWRPMVELGGSLLSIEVPPARPTGSGDTLPDYLRLAVATALALLLGFVWAFDTRRTNQEAVLDFSRDYLRLSLAATMLSYGMAKVLMQQFEPLDQYTLFEAYGESSPMGLLWRFMGFSSVYTRFAGLTEVLAAVLLLWRRTTTAGALVCAIVMTNVVLLNFCFDVPVKLLSTHLLVFALVLLVPDVRRLLAVLFTNQQTLPRDFSSRYAAGHGRLVMPVLTVLFAVAILGSTLSMPEYDPLPEDVEIDGSYTVVRQSGGISWHFVQFGSGAAYFRRGAENLTYAKLHRDGQTLTIGDQTLSWARRDGALVLTGTWEKEPIEVTLQKLEVAQQPLLTRGFHWVQPTPFNR